MSASAALAAARRGCTLGVALLRPRPAAGVCLRATTLARFASTGAGADSEAPTDVDIDLSHRRDRAAVDKFVENVRAAGAGLDLKPGTGGVMVDKDSMNAARSLLRDAGVEHRKKEEEAPAAAAAAAVPFDPEAGVVGPEVDAARRALYADNSQREAMIEKLRAAGVSPRGIEAFKIISRRRGSSSAPLKILAAQTLQRMEGLGGRGTPLWEGPGRLEEDLRRLAAEDFGLGPDVEPEDTRGVPNGPQITRLGVDAYGWGVERDMKQAPLWMLYEAERLEERLPRKGQRPFAPVADNSRVELLLPMRDASGSAYAYGGRKCASAQVWVRQGDGRITVNGRPLHVYFPRVTDRKTVLEPLMVTMAIGAFDVDILVKGGGPSGQSGAARHGLAGALARFDPNLKPILRKFKLVQRDPRMVERKKPGQKKARKKFQWVKR